MNKTALITGICGQDGPYLAQFILEKGYHVIGTTRLLSAKNDFGLKYLGIDTDVEIIELNDFSLSNLKKILTQHQPNEIYNLAAQSSVGESFLRPLETFKKT